jgi:signal transduction histidine kinase
MVDIIASRAAAFRLTWIIIALMVPILFLGHFMFTTLQTETAVVQRETDGVALIHDLIPVYIDAARDGTDAANIKTLLENGPRLANSVGVSSAFAILAETLNEPKPTPSVVTENIRELISLTSLSSEHSGVSSDPQDEIYHLAASVSERMPSLLNEFKDLRRAVKLVSANDPNTPDKFAQLLMDTGQLLASSDRAINELKLASADTADEAPYGTMANLSTGMKFRISSFGAELKRNFMHPENITPSTFFESDKIAGPFLDQHKALWSQAAERLSGLLTLRQAALAKKMSILLIVSLASTLLGLGLAIAMFKFTLKRLDGVEVAKTEAEIARHEAEELAGRLSGINDDMVRMNQELGSNMQMLKDAQGALVKKGRMEQMGQLTATIAHELRNPLGAVRTSAFLIERKIKDKGLGVESQLLRINNGITRCDNIITQLLDFSRSKQLVSRAADLDEWLAKIIEEECKQLPIAVSIECTLGLDGLEVPFDPARLQRALINLISNASEAMVGNGEDPSRFAVSEPRMQINTWRAGESVVIEVKDNGPGISAENLQKIREPLFTTKSFGTGLGLPAVEQIASQHGGSLEVKSEIGMGASFLIRLPLSPPEELAA